MQVPANKLAEFITAQTPERRERLVRQVKQGGLRHPIYYQCFHSPTKEFLIGGATDAAGILRAIEELKGRTATKWYETDSRITSNALKALIALSPRVHGMRAEFVPTGKSAALLKVGDVKVSVRPNLFVHGTCNGKPLVGALRFYLAKESPFQLGVRRAELVATMQYLWLAQIATGTRTLDPEHCVVVECIQQRLTTAPADPTGHVATIERGCRDFVAMWHRLDAEEAA